MAFVKKDRVRETTTIVGTGPITLLGAPNGYQTFGSSMSIGDVTWYALVMPGGGWETGFGTYTALNTLARTTVFESSNSGSLVSFPAGTKDIFVCQPASQAQPAFPSGTLMLFQQTNAPIYWTKQTTHNDKALRVVSGAASSGGANTFSGVFGSGSGVIDGHVLTIAEMPAHTHVFTVVSGSEQKPLSGGNPAYINTTTANTGSTGGNASHTHTLSMNLAYVDLIICQKD